jgi:hypothetical protein
MKLLIMQHSPTFCYFLSLGPNIFFSRLFTKTLSLCPYLDVRQHVHNHTKQQIILQISLHIFKQYMKDITLNYDCPSFSMAKDPYPGHTWKKNNKWYTYPPKLLCNFYCVCVCVCVMCHIIKPVGLHTASKPWAGVHALEQALAKSNCKNFFVKSVPKEFRQKRKASQMTSSNIIFSSYQYNYKVKDNINHHINNHKEKNVKPCNL